MKALGLLAIGALACGCAQEEPPQVVLERCDRTLPDAGVTVAGVYDYQSPVWHLYGTISFEQEGSHVSVVETTYSHEDARSLVGEADLEGNRLDITLTPENGDTDYSADVTLIFEDGGERFCLLQFTDTNDDRGGEGTYRGRRAD